MKAYIIKIQSFSQYDKNLHNSFDHQLQIAYLQVIWQVLDCFVNHNFLNLYILIAFL